MYKAYFSPLVTDNAAVPDLTTLPPATQTVLVGSFGQLLSWLTTQNATLYGTLPNGSPWWAPLFPLWVVLFYNGPGPIFEASGLTVMRTLQPSIFDIVLKGSGLRASSGCQTLYTKFATFLGDDLKLNVDFIATRGRGLVKVNYKQPGSDKRNITTCRRMIVSAVQSYDNLKAFLKDMDATERATFDPVTYSLYTYTLFNSIPTNLSNLPLIDVPGLTNKDLPTTVTYRNLLPNYAWGWHLSLSPDDNAQAAVERMYNNATLWSQALVNTGQGFTLPLTLEAAISVGPEEHQYDPRPKVAANMAQVYNALYGIQGYRNVYYTGALYAQNSQSAVWTYSKWLIDTYFTGRTVWRPC